MSLTESLKRLPGFDPPAGGWIRLQGRLDSRPHRPRRRAAIGLALAAALALALALDLLRPGAPVVAPVPTGDAEVARLMQQSQGLEQNLAQIKPQVDVWTSNLAARSATLENELALVDLQLNYASEPAGARRLWHNRVLLMAELVQTHRQAVLQPAAYPTNMEQYL